MKNLNFHIDQFNLNNDSILDDLPKEVMDILNRNLTVHKYKKGEIVFKEGGYPTGIYFITKGKVKKFKTDKDGNEHIFYVCKHGEIMGYHALISEEKYVDTACTLEDSIISFIPKDDFFEVLKSSPILSNRLLKALSHEFVVFVNGISIFAYKTVRERLALSLLILKNKYKKDTDNDDEVEITVSREDLAKMVGTARETLTRLLRDFREDELIALMGKRIVILKPLEISKIANLY